MVAVSKSKPASSLRSAAMAGVTDFGENYVQEALAKQQALADLDLTWHFIGGLQSNKTRAVAERFQWVHSVDRLGLAQRLSDQRPFHAPPLNVCLQVALVPESTKGGIDKSGLKALAAATAGLPRIKLRGLMCVPPPQPSGGAGRAIFSELRHLLEMLNAAGHSLDVLSMGMSADFETAIAEGATHVRIGTALFGGRDNTINR